MDSSTTSFIALVANLGLGAGISLILILKGLPIIQKITENLATTSAELKAIKEANDKDHRVLLDVFLRAVETNISESDKEFLKGRMK